VITSSHSQLATPHPCPICPGALEFPARSDKQFCSDACRSLNWQRKNRVPVSAYTVEDFEGLRAAIAWKEQLLADGKRRLIGYSLKRLHPKRELARIGEVEFPDPGRKTKRFPDESGVTRVLRGRYFRWAPFEPPRVPVAGYYSVSLHYEDGKVLVAGAHEVAKAFPSVPFYDKEGNRYDLKGKVIPKRSPATPKARRKYVPRQHRAPEAVLSVEPTIVEHIRVAVARAVQAEREADRLRGQATPPPDNKEQAARLDSLSEKVAMLTAKLTAAETQISQAEARAARAEAQLAQTLQSMEEKAKHTALFAAVANDSLHKSQQERARLLEQIAALRSAPASLPTAEKTISAVVESPTVASKPAPVQQNSAAVPPAPAPAKPATVPIEQSVPRATGQAAPPPTAVKPVPLRRNTLSILKPGGNIK
jgi:predicted nucleic acid-binding Zn ribbon protein